MTTLNMVFLEDDIVLGLLLPTTTLINWCLENRIYLNLPESKNMVFSNKKATNYENQYLQLDIHGSNIETKPTKPFSSSDMIKFEFVPVSKLIQFNEDRMRIMSLVCIRCKLH